MKRTNIIVISAAVLALGVTGTTNGQASKHQQTRSLKAGPIVEWSTQARRAIVPPGPGGVFGKENYGNKFPGEAAIYMGIVHAALYDTAVAIAGGYRPYAIALTAPANISSEAAIATAAHHVLAGLDLNLATTELPEFENRYRSVIEALPADQATANGIALGEQVASAILKLREGDGRERQPKIEDLNPPPAGPGVWDPGAATAVGLRVPGIRPLALERASQFRPDGPNPLRSSEYTDDFEQVERLGSSDSTDRPTEQTLTARFWTDHDLRQWNDGLLRLVEARNLNLLETARMLAMAHVSGGDAMIACFDAKYTYWFWRPYQAIPKADTDGNPDTVPNPGWEPLGTTPNFPEYPSAHACHSSAMAEALRSFFGTDKIPFSLDSRITGTTHDYARFHDVVKEVDRARVLVGFHFRNSDEEGAVLGRKIARYVEDHFFQRGW